MNLGASHFRGLETRFATQSSVWEGTEAVTALTQIHLEDIWRFDVPGHVQLNSWLGLRSNPSAASRPTPLAYTPSRRQLLARIHRTRPQKTHHSTDPRNAHAATAMPTPESEMFLAKKPKVKPTFEGVDYDDNQALKAAQDAIIREQWVKSMMARLVREEMGKCYRREGVNHLEKCGHLRGMCNQQYPL